MSTIFVSIQVFRYYRPTPHASLRMPDSLPWISSSPSSKIPSNSSGVSGVLTSFDALLSHSPTEEITGRLSNSDLTLFDPSAVGPAMEVSGGSIKSAHPSQSEFPIARSMTIDSYYVAHSPQSSRKQSLAEPYADFSLASSPPVSQRPSLLSGPSWMQQSLQSVGDTSPKAINNANAGTHGANSASGQDVEVVITPLQAVANHR